MFEKLIIAAVAIAAPSTPVYAQALQCSTPDRLPRPRVEGPSPDQPRRVRPTTGYTLAISWSPQHCAGRTDGDDRFQCGGRNGRFGFVLHGLWPDGVGKEWPQYCRAAPLLPEAVIRRNLCMTPSVQLLQHEWAKHGTCMTTRPTAYFDQARKLYAPIRFPDMADLARRRTLTAGALAAAFASENRGMRADMMRITTKRDGWLDEVWLCLDRRFALRRCPVSQGGVKPTARVKIRPVG